MRVAVLADTHSPRHWKRCPPMVAAQLERADLIVHAGDVCHAETLHELQQWAPVRVALGNNDGPDVAAWGATDVVHLDLAGLPVVVIHESGPAGGRGQRLRRRFPSAELVIFGHSHIPWDQQYQGQRAFNPGSPTDRRRQPHGTIGELVIEDGRLVTSRLITVT